LTSSSVSFAERVSLRQASDAILAFKKSLYFAEVGDRKLTLLVMQTL